MPTSVTALLRPGWTGCQLRLWLSVWACAQSTAVSASWRTCRPPSWRRQWWQSLVALSFMLAQPMWRMLYKLLIAKRTGDLQWWLLPGILATSTFIHHMDVAASTACLFYLGEVEEDLFHAFLGCPWLMPLFSTIGALFEAPDLYLSEASFLFSFLCQAAEGGIICLDYCLPGRVKMAIFNSCRNRLTGASSEDTLCVFQFLV